MDDGENGTDGFLGKYKIPLLMGLVGFGLLLAGVFSSGSLAKLFAGSSSANSESKKAVVLHPTPAFWKVEVSGEVVNPGVYSLPVEARVEDALRIAGGVTVSADQEYLLKSVNLAQKISDGMKIYIPKTGEAGVSNISGVSSSTLGSAVVNLNTASLNDLDQLPGVGPVTAQAILDRRPYSAVEELLAKKVVSKSVYEKIKDLVSI